MTGEGLLEGEPTPNEPCWERSPFGGLYVKGEGEATPSGDDGCE